MPSSSCPIVPFCLVLSCNPPQGGSAHSRTIAGSSTSIYHHNVHSRSGNHTITQSLYWLPVYRVRLLLHGLRQLRCVVCV
jgi:hypothetical protein